MIKTWLDIFYFPDKSRNLVTSATSLPGSMYPHQVSSICVSSKGQPQNGYMAEPPKLNHLPVTRAPPGNLLSQHPANQISPPMTHPVLPPHFGRFVFWFLFKYQIWK